ncbi:MAG: DUF2948 family protein [Pseudomonadota bacterium]
MSETADSKPLRLMAEEPEDLKVIAAAVQDALARAGDLKFDARRRRFSIEINRFRWEAAGPGRKGGERVRAVLAFDSVLGVKARGVTKSDPEMIISLLSVDFEPGEAAPAGHVKLLFAGDGEMALEVECLDATLLDSDTAWSAKRRPDHDRKHA